MTSATFQNKYNNASTGLFKDNSTGDIGADDARTLVTDIVANIPFFDDNDLTFFPLSGTADLAAAVTIDGNAFDLTFGSPNILDNFEVQAVNFLFQTTGANADISLISDDDIILEADDVISLTSDDGVDSTSLTIVPSGVGFNFLSGGVSELSGDWNIANSAQAHSVIFGPDYTTTFDPLSSFYVESNTLQLVSSTNVLLLTSQAGTEIRALANNGVALFVRDDGNNDIFRCDESAGARRVGFFGTGPVAKQTVTGSRGGNAALASLLTAMANFGLITDSTTA